MKIGVVGEYIQHDGRYHFANEAQGFLEYAAREHDVYVLHPADQGKDTHFPAVNLSSGKKELVDVPSLNGIYFGLVGKKLWQFDQNNCLSLQLERFCNTLEFLRQFENKIAFVNPSEGMIYNTSKQYIFDLELPFIESEKVESLDHLMKIAKTPGFIAKPLIAERAKGLVFPDRMSEDELQEYGDCYLSPHTDRGSIYDRIQVGQGIMVQPYQESFRQLGERKIAVVGGEVTLPRTNEADVEIVTYANGARILKFDPTPEEAAIAVRAFNVFNERFPVHYMRVDIVGGPGDLRINELEVINPDFATMDKIFTDAEHNDHYERVLQAIARAEPVKKAS